MSDIALPQLLPECQVPARQFCELCRHRRKGRGFRVSILQVRGVEAHEDFGCPRGLPWIKEAPRGLGDTIEAFTRKLGIKTCGGCNRRKAKLNQIFPYQRKERP